MYKKICVVASSDEGYAMPMTVALCSAASSIGHEYQVALYVLDAGIEQKTRERSEAALKASHPKVQVFWEKPDVSRFADLDAQRYTVAAFLRLLIPEVVSSDISRVLYIDCDTVVTDDLSRLWNIDFEAHAFLAVSNPIGTHFYDKILSKLENASVSRNSPYFNSGVLLINLPIWREARISENALDFLRANEEDLSFPDQDALNAVSIGLWGELDARWNAQTHRLTRSEKSQGITHYTSKKPWKPDYLGPRAQDFFKAYIHSGWDGTFRSCIWVAYCGVRQILGRVRRKASRLLSNA